MIELTNNVIHATLKDYYQVKIGFVSSPHYTKMPDTDTHEIYVQLYGGDKVKLYEKPNGRYEIYLPNNRYNVFVIGNIMNWIDEGYQGNMRDEKKKAAGLPIGKNIKMENKAKLIEMMASQNIRDDRGMWYYMNLYEVRKMKSLASGKYRPLVFEEERDLKNNFLQEMVMLNMKCKTCRACKKCVECDKCKECQVCTFKKW